MRGTATPARFGPMSLTLPNFWSTLGSRSAFLRWETATELDNPDFYIEPADSLIGPYTHTNAELSPSPQPGRLIAAADEFVDNVVASHPTADDSYAIVDIHVPPTTCSSFIVPIGMGACPVYLPSVDR